MPEEERSNQRAAQRRPRGSRWSPKPSSHGAEIERSVFGVAGSAVGADRLAREIQVTRVERAGDGAAGRPRFRGVAEGRVRLEVHGRDAVGRQAVARGEDDFAEQVVLHADRVVDVVVRVGRVGEVAVVGVVDNDVADGQGLNGSVRTAASRQRLGDAEERAGIVRRAVDVVLVRRRDVGRTGRRNAQEAVAVRVDRPAGALANVMAMAVERDREVAADDLGHRHGLNVEAREGDVEVEDDVREAVVHVDVSEHRRRRRVADRQDRVAGQIAATDDCAGGRVDADLEVGHQERGSRALIKGARDGGRRARNREQRGNSQARHESLLH